MTDLLSMKSYDKIQVPNFVPWDDMWLVQEGACENPMFGSVFKLPAEIQDYFKQNKRPDSRGILKPSFAGWKMGIPGLVAVDVDEDNLESDEENLAAAQKTAQRIAGRLRDCGVSQNSFVPFLSGRKGFGLHFLASAFGEKLNLIPAGLRIDGKRELPQHERAVHLALEAVTQGERYDHGLYQTLRLYRCPNSKHDKVDRFKVPLTLEELMTHTPKALLGLAAKPRLDIPAIPSGNPDPALEELLLEKIQLAMSVERDMGERKAFVKREPRGTSAQSVECPVPPPQLDSFQASIVSDSIPQLCSTHPFLRDAWNSVPRKDKPNNSSSDFDFRLASELFLLDWNPSLVLQAIVLRPGHHPKPQAYYQTTLLRAKEHADCVKARSLTPADRILACVDRSLSNEWYSFVMYSPLWKPGYGVGKGTRDVYIHHVNVARKCGHEPDPQGWMGPYFLSRGDICGNSRACGSEHTMDKAHVLLESMGLMKKVNIGGRSESGNRATEFMIKTFSKDEESELLRVGRATLSSLKDPEGRVRLGRRYRDKARSAGNRIKRSHSNPRGAVGQEGDPGE